MPTEMRDTRHCLKDILPNLVEVYKVSKLESKFKFYLYVIKVNYWIKKSDLMIYPKECVHQK